MSNMSDGYYVLVSGGVGGDSVAEICLDSESHIPQWAAFVSRLHSVYTRTMMRKSRDPATGSYVARPCARS